MHYYYFFLAPSVALTFLFTRNATGVIFAVVSLVTKSVRTGINSAASSLRLDANAMTRAFALCQEFSDSVESGMRVLELEDFSTTEIEEIKCSVPTLFFTALTERMVGIGYCCTQVQRDIDSSKCTAWFELATLD
tara:strand:+ start:7451 stop:7855 length:405 start_codon:yes stop_codon:yes gene_type:complete